MQPTTKESSMRNGRPPSKSRSARRESAKSPSKSPAPKRAGSQSEFGTWARDLDIGWPQKSFLLLLVSYVEIGDDSGICWPTQAELSEKMHGATERYIHDLTKLLEKDNVVYVERRRSAGGRVLVNVYHFDPATDSTLKQQKRAGIITTKVVADHQNSASGGNQQNSSSGGRSKPPELRFHHHQNSGSKTTRTQVPVTKTEDRDKETKKTPTPSRSGNRSARGNKRVNGSGQGSNENEMRFDPDSLSPAQLEQVIAEAYKNHNAGAMTVNGHGGKP